MIGKTVMGFFCPQMPYETGKDRPWRSISGRGRCQAGVPDVPDAFNNGFRFSRDPPAGLRKNPNFQEKFKNSVF